MGEGNKTTEKLKNAAKTGEGFVKGVKSYYSQLGSKLFLKFKTGKVNVGQSGSGNQWIFRFEAGHPGTNTNFDHINLNTKFSGLSTDPHIQLPPGGLKAAEATAKVCQVVNYANKYLAPIAMVIDVCRVGYAGYHDYQNGTTRNVVQTSATVAGGWVGGYSGAMSGAAIGNAFLPGFGTIIGGVIGGLGGGITGAFSIGKAVGVVGDKVEYNIEEIECESCKEKFKARKYRGEKKCPRCEEKLSGSDENQAAEVEHKIEIFECDNCKAKVICMCVDKLAGDETIDLIDKKIV